MASDREESIRLYQAMDRMQKKYGGDIIQRAATMHVKALGRFNPFTGEPPVIPAHRRM